MILLLFLISSENYTIHLYLITSVTTWHAPPSYNHKWFLWVYNRRSRMPVEKLTTPPPLDFRFAIRSDLATHHSVNDRHMYGQCQKGMFAPELKSDNQSYWHYKPVVTMQVWHIRWLRAVWLWINYLRHQCRNCTKWIVYPNFKNGWKLPDSDSG